MEGVPRAAFVPRHAAMADRDIALPIGCGQTMLAPFHVARVLEALDTRPDSRVLEVGSGAGYGTAVLAGLAREVVSVERFASLATAAMSRLRDLNLDHAHIRWEDGQDLGSDLGVFDRIVVDVALDHEPSALLDRLADGGILVYPLRSTAEAALGRAAQTMMRLTRQPHAGWERKTLWPCGLQAVLPGRAAFL